MIKAFIFDLDGVLVFTDQFHYQAWKKIADRLGIYFDEKINNRLRGVSRTESLEIILENYKESLTEEEKTVLLKEKNEIYRQFLGDMTEEDVSEKVRETLAELKRAGYLLAVGSSSKNARYILEKTKLISVFDAISDGNNITHSKPHPEVFEKAAEFLQVEAEACVVVEDAGAGIEAAKAAGMTAVGIGPAKNDNRVDIGIDRFSELVKIAENI